MPSLPEEGEQFKFDARVGQWDNGKLIGYFRDKGHRLVSNEWEPFPRDKLQLRRDAPGAGLNGRVPELELVGCVITRPHL